MIGVLALKLVENRNAVALFSLVLAIVAITGIPNLIIKDDIRSFFNEDDPHLKQLDLLNETFKQSDKIGIVIDAKGETVFNKERLHVIKKVTEKARDIPYAVRVDSLVNRNRLSNKNFYNAPLFEDIAKLSDTDMAEIKEYATNNNEIKNIYLSKRHDASAVIVTLDLPSDNLQEHRSIIEFTETLTKALKLHNSDFDFRVFGELVTRNTIFKLNMYELTVLIPTVLVVMFLVIWVMLGSLTAVFSIFLMTVLCVTATLGTFGWLSYSLNANSMAAPQLVIILVMADSIHLLSSYVKELKKGGSKTEAMTHSLTVNIYPILLTSVTTAIGFLCLNFGSDPSMKDFGYIVALGVMYAFFFSILILPAISLLFPATSSGIILSVNTMVERIGVFVVNRKKESLLTVVCASLICMSFLPKISIDQQFDEFFDKDHSHRKSADILYEKFGVGRSILYVIDSEIENGVNSLDFLQQVDEFSTWLEQQEGIVTVSSYLDILKQVSQTLNQGDPSYYRIPESQSLASKYLYLYRYSLDNGEDLTRDINAERSALRLVVNLERMSNQQLLLIEAQASHWLAQFSPDLKVTASGYDLLFAHHTTKVAKELLVGSFAALLVISAVLIMGLGSIKYGMISLVPNVFPAAVVFGVWALLIGKVNPNTVALFSISIGLVVNDTVHFLSKYLHAKRRGNTAEESVLHAFQVAGPALFITTIALCIGISVLGLSGWVPIQHIAMLLMPIIGVALIIDFFLLPPLLLIIDGNKISTVQKRRVLDSS